MTGRRPMINRKGNVEKGMERRDKKSMMETLTERPLPKSVFPYGSKNETVNCNVVGSSHKADYEVIHYNFSLSDGEVIFERDATCPFICRKHAMTNESMARGQRKPDGVMNYTYTNTSKTKGFTIYKPLI